MNLIARRALVVVVAVIGLGAGAAVMLQGPTGDDLIFVPLGMVLVGVGSLLVLRVPENRISWLVLALGASIGLMGLGSLVFEQETADVITGVVLFAVFIPGLAVLVPLWFPTGYPPSRRWAWVGWAAAVGVSLIFFGQALKVVLEGGSLSSLDSCTSVGRCTSVGGLLIILLAIVSAVASFIVRWRRSEGIEKVQLRWLLPSFVVLGIGFLAEFGSFQDSFVAVVFGTAGMLMVPVSIGVAILRYRLYEIDRIVSRTVAYTVVVSLLGVLFAAGVVWLPSALGLDSTLAVAGTTLAVAFLFNPLRKRVQTVVDRRFNRSRFNTERVMEEFAGSLRDRVDPEGVVAGWLDVVEETLQPAGIGVWVR